MIVTDDACRCEVLQYRDRRCITEQQCRSMRSVFGVAIGDIMQQQQLWKVRDDGVCDVKCPADNYTESLTDPHLCIKCADSCPKGYNAVYCCSFLSYLHWLPVHN